jgi:hypothetical protein
LAISSRSLISSLVARQRSWSGNSRARLPQTQRVPKPRDAWMLRLHAWHQCCQGALNGSQMQRCTFEGCRQLA